MNNRGFSAVEALITLLIATVFILAFFEIRNVIVGQGAAAAQYSKANTIAYSGLKSVLVRPSTFVCDNNSNLVANSAATGWTLSTTTLSEPGLPPSSTMKLVLFAPKGCAVGTPVLVVATVTYGTRSVSHSEYVPYE